ISRSTLRHLPPNPPCTRVRLAYSRPPCDFALQQEFYFWCRSGTTVWSAFDTPCMATKPFAVTTLVATAAPYRPLEERQYSSPNISSWHGAQRDTQHDCRRHALHYALDGQVDARSRPEGSPFR